MRRSEQASIQVRGLAQLEWQEGEKRLALLKCRNDETSGLSETQHAADTQKQNPSAKPTGDAPEANS